MPPLSSAEGLRTRVVDVGEDAHCLLPCRVAGGVGRITRLGRRRRVFVAIVELQR
jgi:hypothetical protein